ncbi:hypothetical protein CONPUDRAFT_25842, partial [Coniophora puteana RWD-64-598 SS2]
ASKRSHTGAHIFGVLNKVLLSIGPERFRGISSDSTGNTSVARKLVKNQYPWIIILPDPCHRANLLAGDICRLPFFAPVIRKVQRTLKFFKKSTHATSHLKAARKEQGIGRGLVSVGKTRFVMLYHAGRSVQRCYPAIESIVTKKTVTLPVCLKVNDWHCVNYCSQTDCNSCFFRSELACLVAVLAPIAKATTCLEATNIDVSSVYEFWLAITASMKDILTTENEDFEIPAHASEQIRRRVNYRFNQMVNETPDDVYLTGFVLNP